MNAPAASSDQAVVETELSRSVLDEGLCRRLALAKIKLDRLERDVGSKDQGALSASRIEFALASRALADALIAQGYAQPEQEWATGAER
ncbi:hypothetical protein ACOJCM_08220 [Billgrantia sp. LNSP4103-1]|uniref:hypothetical protein n=1 Tax=Billgrantia sp. LNSP4103-1 TaxID=3410266 RepID=UPI00403F0DFB